MSFKPPKEDEFHPAAHSNWRCSLLGGGEWYVTHAAGAEAVNRELMDTGVEVPRYSFVGTAFRQMETLKLAARVDA